ncbi:unnamed protein product [Rotaria sp. Silwood1]|nr:unnamed protein product [Rotaria sp. Silwood1]CAF1505123.1 unnamed protein product [Rotaria sp. Silwood1]CAF4998064.1 unnamed protein product [Rotaria sp. Silwood1]
MDESILNHLFLPPYLPSSADEDFLIQNNHENEYKLLEFMKEYLDNCELTNNLKTLPIFHVFKDKCLQNWCQLQNIRNFSTSNLQSTIEQLSSGGFLPLYFEAQNAAILTEIEANNIDQPLISSWQVLLPTASITSSLTLHLSCFPVSTYRLKNRFQLNSKAHCELLVDFMRNTIEYSKSWKASHRVDEIRDIPESHYKKHRDHIRWNNAKLPFRRSGLWLTIKVVLQTILTKHLGNVGIVIYKLLITHFLTYVVDINKNDDFSYVNQDEYIPSMNELRQKFNYTIGTVLSRIELWVESRLDQWINHPKESHDESNRFEILFNFYEEYQNLALNHY